MWDGAKKLKLIIDSSKVDEDLTDFPVLITLSSGCGVGVFDASGIFDELSVERILDPFTGTNGSLPDSNLWTCSSNDIQIYNNKLRFNNSTSDFWVISNFYLYGDFSVQVDFDLNVYPSTNSWAMVVQFKCANGDYVSICKEYSSSAHRYTATRYINGTGYWNHSSSSDTSGKMQITRTGNTFSFYKWTSSTQSWYGFFTGEVQELNKICYIRLIHSNWTGNPSFGFDFDNFSINYGNVFFPKRLTVSATVSGTETQCYTEIESWNPETKEAILWTKVPTIISGSNTELGLYYDVAHVNDSYIGLTGETAAQNVWDNNFVGVWHMADDPALSDNCIPDSTSNVNDGSPAGSMTTADLVDGKIGKALDFDGNNDNVAITDDAIFDVGSKLSLECIFKTSIEQSSVGLLVHDDSNYKYMLYLTSLSVNFSFYIRTATGVSSATTAHTYSDGVPYYMVGTYDKALTERLALYRNGTVVDTGTGYNEDILDGDEGINLTYWGSNYFTGILDEVRISNIARSAPWIKATYYSNWDQLIAYEQLKYYFVGYTLEDMAPVSRVVRVYSSSNGGLVGETTSSGTTGYYQVWVNGGDSHYLICMDADVLPDYNNLIVSKAVPYEV